MTIENVNNQLKITYDSGTIEYYSFSDIKSVSPYHANNGESYAVINFINENRNSSLKLPLSLLTAYSVIEDAVSDISIWLTGSGTAANRKGTFERPTADGEINDCYSFSIANVGSADGLVGGVTLKAGETISFDAGAVGNKIGKISYDATGTEFIIITVE